MKKILRYLGKYKKETILAPLFKLLEALLELFVPLVMARMTDVGILQNQKGQIIQNGLLLIALAVVGIVFSITAQFFAAKAAVGLGCEVRSALFKTIQSLSFSDRDQIGSSTLITRMTSDVNQVQAGTNLVLRLFLRSPFIVFGAMIMAFRVDVRAALIFAVAIPLLAAVVFGIMLISIPLYKKVQAALDRVVRRTRENLAGARVIRAFAKEDEEQKSFEGENTALTDLQLFVGRISALMNPVTYIIVNIAIIAIIWTGGKEVYAGVLTQGAVVALVNYMSQILVELIKFANLIININKSIASGNRIAEMMELKPGMAEGEADCMDTEHAAYMVEFENVAITYPGAREEALSDVCLKVRAGETIGVIGGTGSGKSTLVNLIPRFYDVTKGTLKVAGRDVREYQFEALRSQIGCVPQKAELFAGTIRENLLFGNENATEEMLWAALETAQAADMVREKGLDAPVEEGGKNLSGGQKQRLTIARALVRNPKILILDDSASALDFATDAALRRALHETQSERTVFIVSQRSSSVFQADQIVVLDDGEVAGIGTHGELLNSCPVYKEIHLSQYRKEDE